MNRVAGLATRRPRTVIAAWLATVLVLGLFGLGLEDKLSTKAMFVSGSETERAHDLTTREFGDENAFFVLLRGPRAEIESQGRVLERRLEALPRTVVNSPWEGGSAIEGLRPSPDALALLVSVERLPDQPITDLTAPVREEVGAVNAPVETSIAGAPVLAEAFRVGAADAVASAERVALPLLLLILLVVFRSVLAAAIPVIVGGAVVLATRGVLDLLAGTVRIDALALATAAMMGLALGVDYALLIVSRFREELKRDDDVVRVARRTVVATGRSVVPAGCGLLLAMVVASLTLPGSIVTSVAFAVSVASVLSVVSALLVVPAILTLLGTRLDRWALPGRRGGTAAAAAWSQRLSRRPALVWPLVLLLLVAAGWAFSLDSKVGTVAQLSPDDSRRLQQEDVQDALGAGWVAPLEVVMEGNGEPVTTPARLRALADFQRQVEADPDVDTMAGLAAIERGTRPLSEVERSLAAQRRGLDRLGEGIGSSREGAAASADGFAAAAAGATQLNASIGETEAGAGLLAEGARDASEGSERLTDGLGQASDGSGELARGTAKSSAGAGRLTEGIERAAEGSGEATTSSRLLQSAMRRGEMWLDGVRAPLRGTEAQLVAARQALEAMSAGRADPQFAAALEAVDAASRELTGTDPASGEPVSSSEGVAAGVEHADSQFGLGTYLASQVGENGREGQEGLERLARSSAQLDRGLRRLAGASEQVSEAIAGLSAGGRELSPALVRLSEGTDHLAGGLGEVQDGAAGLASGLGSGAAQSGSLTDALARIESGVERQRESAGETRVDGSPGLFRSGYFYLASLDGAAPERRGKAAFLVNIDRGGSAARMLVIPASDPSSSETAELTDRLRDDAAALAERTGAEVLVGGEVPNVDDLDASFRDAAPLARIALCLVTLIVLIPVVRSLTLALIAAVFNLLTVSATFGLLALLFDGSLLGGPGYVETTVIPATIMIIFGLAIDYEVFLFARMREEYERTGSATAAIENGLGSTAHVITGAALIMITVFLVFSFSSMATLRNFGVAQALAVFIDAFVVRLILLPAAMRWIGDWAWWMPCWLERLVPGGGRPAPVAEAV